MKPNTNRALLAALALLPAAAFATNGLRIERQNPVNSIVRVDSTARYLLLPVQEDAPMCDINVLVNGAFDSKMRVALAEHRIDYYVPFMLEPYGDSKVILNVKSTAGRSSLREASDAVWNKRIELSDTFDTANREKFRPLFHHTPQWGWMNDPNGMFYKDGVWHLYFQHNPYGSKWENLSWGHSTSTDLVNWEAQPEAIRPVGLGYIFSGSSVVDKDNTAGYGKDAIIALYTAADASQVQNMAYSTDGGMTFTEYEANPVIVFDRESRDPNMFWHEPTQQWVLLIASALDHEMLIYNSPDLKNWTLASKFGHGYGAQDGVWECPDLMEIEVDGTGQKKWVLICNLNPGGIYGGSATQYFVGDFDGKTFTPDEGPEVTKWMDWGKDHYATVSFSNAPDGRHTVLGWMSNWEYANEVPTLQYRSANTIARDLSLFTGEDGKVYLASAPSPENLTMRGKAIKSGTASLGKKARNYALPTANDGICEIVATLEVNDKAVVDLTLANAAGEKVVMTLSGVDDTFTMDRREAGLSKFSENFPAVTIAPVHNGSKWYTLRIFVDRSSIEAFENRGRFAMTNLVFPENPYTTLSVSAPMGKAKLRSLDIYPLQVKK